MINWPYKPRCAYTNQFPKTIKINPELLFLRLYIPKFPEWSTVVLGCGIFAEGMIFGGFCTVRFGYTVL